MRRLLRTVVTCLVLGAVANVAVAWTLAWVVRFRYPYPDLGPRYQWSDGRVWRGIGGIGTAYGWPMLSMRQTWSHTGVWLDPVIPVPGSRVKLPLTPIAGGFTVNSAFYGLSLLLLWSASRAARRIVRVRRGECPACRYPIGSSPVCVECGCSLPHRHPVGP